MIGVIGGAGVVGLPGAAIGQEVLDGIAAVVNGDVITFSQIRELVGARERALRDQLHGKELVAKVKEVRTAALNDLVDRQLILQEFKKSKFNIPDYVVEERVAQIVREEFGGDRQAFARTLEAQGYSLARFREVEKEKIIVQAMRQQIGTKHPIAVAPQRIADHYHAHQAEFSTPDEVKLRMIVLRRAGGEGASKRQMAAEIRQKILGGAEFDQMAQMYSEDSTQDVGGDWGWVDRKTLNEGLSKVAFALKPGEVSEVLEIGDSCYLLYVEARRNADLRPLAAVRNEIEQKLIAEERRKVEEKWLVDLRAKAHIKTF